MRKKPAPAPKESLLIAETLRALGADAAWVSPELIEKTLQVWQPYYSDPLTADDVAYIISNVGRLLQMLTQSAGRTDSDSPEQENCHEAVCGTGEG